MHGLFNRALQRFLVSAYGDSLWADIIHHADLDAPGFEALLTYEDRLTQNVLASAATLLSKRSEEILEDLGTFLVANPSCDVVRRLLRFGGPDFSTFLLSLSDLPDRARLALPDLNLPDYTLTEIEPGQYQLVCSTAIWDFCHVTLGALRAMADEYGALVALEMEVDPKHGATITLCVYEEQFHEGRSFALGRAS